MTVATKTIQTRTLSLLAMLRSFAAERPSTMEQILHVAEKQAHVLDPFLDLPVQEIPARLEELAPSVQVRYVADLPVPGAAFWANKSWHIHIRASDSLEARVFTLLHQFKQVIDHPQRSQTSKFSNADWETAASHFASQLMAGTRRNSAAPRWQGACL